MGFNVFGLGRKTDEQSGAVFPCCGQCRQNIGVFGEAERRRRLAVFLYLLRVAIARSPIGHRRRHDRAIDRQNGLCRSQHLARRFNPRYMHALWRGQSGRAGDQMHFSSFGGQCCGNGIALFAR